MVRNPRVAPAAPSDASVSGRGSCAFDGRRAISAADQRNVAASRVKTVGMSLTASTSAATAGPTKNPMLSMVLATALAAASSAGSVARDGSRAAWAGRKAVPTTAVGRPRRRRRAAAPWTATIAAAAPTSAARTRSADTITRVLGCRSANRLVRNGATLRSLRFAARDFAWGAFICAFETASDAGELSRLVRISGGAGQPSSESRAKSASTVATRSR